MNYIKITNFLAKGDKSQFDIPVEVQYRYLNKIKEPTNDIARSYAQFKCQMLFISYYKKLIFNLLSFIILIPFILLMFFKRINVKYAFKYDAIIEKSTHQGVLPNSLREKYDISSDGWSVGVSYGLNDIPWILKIITYVYRSPYFVFKVLYKSALYSTMIKKFRPNTIIVYNEYSFTSSALTKFCENNGVVHINVMHGEKLFFIRDSFFRFSISYVWEQYYVELLSKLRAPKKQFIIELPPFMNTDPHQFMNKNAYADYKYYLASYDENTLKHIINSLSNLIKNGETIKYRPHPRYSDITLLKRFIPDDQIEYPQNVDIETSISNLKYGIGLYTTVLNQCYHAGIGVIIDDVNFPKNYELLHDLEYVLLNKDVKYLSNFK